MEGNASDRISFWNPFKPQHSNPNPTPLANQLWCIDFITPPTPLIIPHRLPSFLESLMNSKIDAWFMQDGPKAVWSIPYVSVASFFPSLKQNIIAYRSSKVSDGIFEIHQLWQSGFRRLYSIAAAAVHLNLKSQNLVCHLKRCIAITYWILKSLQQF